MIQPLHPSGARPDHGLVELAGEAACGPVQALPRPNHTSTLAQVTSIRASLAAQLTYTGVRLAPPGPHDLVVLLRGMPVAPWIPLRAATDVWSTWLGQLERLWMAWGQFPPPEDALHRIPWDAWRTDHVVSLQARRVNAGVRQLIWLLDRHGATHDGVHLVGHSVGGATVLTYLAAWRMGQLPNPPLRVRTAITLDAAVTGIAGIWSGARRSLFDPASRHLLGLGAWAAQQGVALVTASNEWDVWSHRQIDDLPYLALTPERPHSLMRQLDGTIHGWLRRTPQLAEALWEAPPQQAPQKDLATSRSQVDWLLGQDSNL